MLSRRDLMMAGALGFPAALSLSSELALAMSPRSAPRMKWEEFIKDPNRLASLKRGVAAMKARRPSDPTSWFYQGAIHAVRPEVIDEAAKQDPAVAQVDQARFWKQCPHGGQSSADFLLWHRAYVYYFERILRDASGDATLSLPYWNYTEASQRSFPVEFADDDADPATQLPRNPLYDHRREQAFAFGLYELTDRTAGAGVIFAETQFFGTSEDLGFAGGVADANVRTRGLIERQPHDLLHFAIGGAIGTGEAGAGEATAGTMASVQTAAFDPIFWVHHCNIDRLWTVWDCLSNPARSWGKLPTKEWFKAKPWFFNDVDNQVQNFPRLHYLDRRNLDVTYDTDLPNCSPLSATDPLKPVPAPAGLSLVVPQSVKSFVLKSEAGAVSETVRISPDKPVTTTIPLGELKEFSGNNVKSVILSAKKATGRRLVLEIVGLTIEGVTSVGYDVFVNAPADAIRDSRSYVGTISLFGTDHRHGQDDPSVTMNQRFDITRFIAQDGFDPKNLSVTIAPFDLLQAKGNRPRLYRSMGITYSGMRVLVLDGSTASPL
jgi:hypothetical protein